MKNTRAGAAKGYFFYDLSFVTPYPAVWGSAIAIDPSAPAVVVNDGTNIVAVVPLSQIVGVVQDGTTGGRLFTIKALKSSASASVYGTTAKLTANGTVSILNGNATVAIFLLDKISAVH